VDHRPSFERTGEDIKMSNVIITYLVLELNFPYSILEILDPHLFRPEWYDQIEVEEWEVLNGEYGPVLRLLLRMGMFIVRVKNAPEPVIFVLEHLVEFKWEGKTIIIHRSNPDKIIYLVDQGDPDGYKSVAYSQFNFN
jgi:hypothetical protein